MARIIFKRGVEAFLSMTFDLDDIKPFRTKRDARDEAMRIVGFTQAQEQLRHILGQCESQAAAELSALDPPEGALRPIKIGDHAAAWIPPELPTR